MNTCQPNWEAFVSHTVVVALGIFAFFAIGRLTLKYLDGDYSKKR